MATSQIVLPEDAAPVPFRAVEDVESSATAPAAAAVRGSSTAASHTHAGTGPGAAHHAGTPLADTALYVLVGQCGNQVGQALKSAKNKVQVDSEAKVVGAGRAVVSEQSGRGSNWALGYTSGHYPRGLTAAASSRLSAGSIAVVDVDTGDAVATDKNRTRGAPPAASSSSSARSCATSNKTGSKLTLQRRSSNKTNSTMLSKTSTTTAFSSCSSSSRPCSPSSDFNMSPEDADYDTPWAGPLQNKSCPRNIFTFDELQHEPFLVRGVKDRVRKMVEQSNTCIDHIVLLHSVAGGTGSGLGSRLMEEFADIGDDIFASGTGAVKPNIISGAVLPIGTSSTSSSNTPIISETCLQAYNACFSAAWMQDFCVSNVLFENDWLLEKVHACGSSSAEKSSRARSGAKGMPSSMLDTAKQMKASTAAGKTAYGEVNLRIAQTLDTIDWDDFLVYVTPMKSHHFAHCYSYKVLPDNIHGSSSSASSHGALGGASGELLEHKNLLKRHVLPPPIAVRAGRDEAGCDQQIEHRRHHLLAAYANVFNPRISLIQPDWLSSNCQPVGWNHNFVLEQKRSARAGGASSGGGCGRIDTDVNLALNWSRTGDVFSGFLRNARKKFGGRVFVHAFEEYGFERAEFENMFETVEQLVCNYSAAMIG